VAWSVELSDHVGVVAWSPAGDVIAAGSMGGEAVLVDAATGCARAQIADHGLGVLDIAWSPDGARVASAGCDGRVVIAGTVDGAVGATASGSGQAHCVAWSPDSRLLACGIGRELIVAGDGNDVVLRASGQPSTVTDVAWSADGRRVGLACYGGVRWYDPARDAAKPARILEWKGSLLCLHVAPDGRHVASGNQDSSVHVWRLWSGRDMEMTGYPAKIDRLAWHPASRLLAVGGPGDVTVWDFGGSGPEGSVPRQIDAHDERLSALAYAPDGSGLATAAADGWVKVWGDSDTAPAASLQVGSGVACLCWAPDSTAMVVGTHDGRLQRLDLR
jgi:WD40 repeat protein